MHYLIVEDDAAICEILKDILALLEDDAVFTLFSNGHETWAWLEQVEQQAITELPDIAFLDIKMPGPQGPDIAARIRAMEAMRHIGIVMMTSEPPPEAEYRQLKARAQADRYLTKPLPGVQGLNTIITEIMAIRHKKIKEQSANS